MAKKFGLHKDTDANLKQTIKLGDSERTKFQTMTVLTENILIDPNNPRCPLINIEDIKDGLKSNDINFHRKQQELETIKNLSLSIKEQGLMHPIVVVSTANNKFTIVAGFRRYLATVLAGIDTIEIRLYKNKPNSIDVMVAQWVENELRENLDLKKSVQHVKKIIDSYQDKNDKILSAVDLAKLLCLGSTTAKYYKKIVSNEIVMDLIISGKVKKMRIARELIQYNSREEILSKLESLLITTEMKEPINKNKAKSQIKSSSLEATKKGTAIKALVDMIISKQEYSEYGDQFVKIKWDTSNGCKNALTLLINVIEKKLEQLNNE
jgi:ParB/RepB/Spo0J family partition protein